MQSEADKMRGKVVLMKSANPAGRTALAVRRIGPVISPELRETALAWLQRRREVISQRLLISMPSRIRSRLEAEIAYIDSCIDDVQEG
jgi:hypothetical protein